MTTKYIQILPNITRFRSLHAGSNSEFLNVTFTVPSVKNQRDHVETLLHFQQLLNLETWPLYLFYIDLNHEPFGSLLPLLRDT